MLTQIALPQDIIDCFIHSLSLRIHSTSDLRAASLVSHAWLEPAQRCLFSHITVYSNNHSIQHPSHVYHLRLAFLASRPDLAKFVRSVDCPSAAYKADELSLLNTLLATFPNVIAFELLSRSGTARDALLISLPGWSQLRHISINTLSPRSETEFKPLPRPQTLTAVNICSINLVTWDNIVMADMLRHIAQTSARDTLGLARLAYMEQPQRDDQEYAWAPMLAVSMREANCFQNLKSLELQIMPNIGRWTADMSGPSRTPISALCIPSLTSLRIQVEEPSTGAYAFLRQLLQTATCPNLDALTVTFSMELLYVEVLDVFPFARMFEEPTGDSAATSLDTQP